MTYRFVIGFTAKPATEKYVLEVVAVIDVPAASSAAKTLPLSVASVEFTHSLTPSKGSAILSVEALPSVICLGANSGMDVSR